HEGAAVADQPAGDTHHQAELFQVFLGLFAVGGLQVGRPAVGAKVVGEGGAVGGPQLRQLGAALGDQSVVVGISSHRQSRLSVMGPGRACVGVRRQTSDVKR